MTALHWPSESAGGRPTAMPCPCGKSSLRLVTDRVAKHTSAVRCDSCGRQAPASLSDAFAIRNWNALIKDAVS